MGEEQHNEVGEAVVMKILINRKPIYDKPWGGGNNFVKAFVECGEKRGHSIVHEFLDDLDCIFIQDPRPSQFDVSVYDIVDYKKSNPDTIIAHRVNECDARKGTSDMDNLLRWTSRSTDITFFVSNWMSNYFNENVWGCEGREVIYNGVDKTVFSPKGKIDNGKANIVTHHWSNNKMKGFDVYQLLDEFVGKAKDFTFTYIGRENGTFKNTKVVAPLFGKELGDELGKYDVYISASRFDPGPNHILEALACELPTYAYIDGGGCLEMVDNKHVYSTFGELSDVLTNKVFYKNDFEVYNWEECMRKYFTAMECLVDQNK